MFESLKQLFQSEVKPAAEREEGREKALLLAAAALLFEIVRADGKVDERELIVMQSALQGTFGLTAEETAELVSLAERESRSAVSLYEFTRLVDAELPEEQKKRIVELLWLVAFADAQKHPLEEHLVRQIAGLLHVPHPDFIDAKIRARTESEARRSARGTTGSVSPGAPRSPLR